MRGSCIYLPPYWSNFFSTFVFNSLPCWVGYPFPWPLILFFLLAKASRVPENPLSSNGQKIIVQTDNSAVIWLYQSKDLVGQPARWIEAIEPYVTTSHSSIAWMKTWERWMLSRHPTQTSVLSSGGRPKRRTAPVGGDLPAVARHQNPVGRPFSWR